MTFSKGSVSFVIQMRSTSRFCCFTFNPETPMSENGRAQFSIGVRMYRGPSAL